MKLKYGIKFTMRNITFTVLTIIQLTMTFYVLYNALGFKHKVYTETNKISKYFEDKKVYMLKKDDVDDIEDEERLKNDKNLESAFNILKNDPEFIFAHQVLFPMLIEKFDGYENFAAYNDGANEIDGKLYFQAKNITANNMSLQQFGLELKEGRFFYDNESEPSYGDKNTIPIVIGADYEKYFKVGDNITYYRIGIGSVNAEVVGVLAENQYIPMDMMRYGASRYANLNNCILSTYSQFETKSLMYDTMFGYNFIIFDKDVSDEKINKKISEIKEKFDKDLGVQVNIKDANKEITVELNAYKKQYAVVRITAITILIFISLTLITSILNSIFKRKKEFSIHIFSGASLKDISIIIYSEMLLNFFVAISIALGIIYYQNKILNLEYIAILLIYLVILSIIVIIIPLIRIFKLGIINIIKGVE